MKNYVSTICIECIKAIGIQIAGKVDGVSNCGKCGKYIETSYSVSEDEEKRVKKK